jgi:hypothetical protein
MTTTDQTEEQWLPLGIEEDQVGEFTALREDVPSWLHGSLWTWIYGQFTARTQAGSMLFKVDLARKCERVLKVSIADAGKYDSASFQALQSTFDAGPHILTWRLVDFLLSEHFRSSAGAKAFDTILFESGSAWKVGERLGKVGLERRLPEGVSQAAESAFNSPNAGKRMARAWEAVFGVHPDPTKAYSMAVKAVEDAAIPVVCSNDRSATLGKVIGQVKAGTWKLPHLREDPSAPTHDVLVGMMSTLWTGQHDRHGGPSSVGVPAVTQAEAESAVMLAVTLVGWFETGKVQQ